MGGVIATVVAFLREFEAPLRQAVRGPGRGPGPGVERDAFHGGWLVLLDGERGVPAGRPRLPTPGGGVVHERRAGPGERVRDGARDRRDDGDDRVRGPAVVASARRVG